MNSPIVVIFITITFVSAYEFRNVRRQRRDAIGSLDIITNHAQPIHADVKIDQMTYDKPCPKSLADSNPAKIEAGVVFKVTPPKAALSLRRSSPLTNTLDLVRGISRLITVIVLAVSGSIEFYPILQGVYETVHELFYLNKF